MSPQMSWTIVGLVVGLPTLLLWCLLRVASRTSRYEEEIREAEIQMGIALARAEQFRREHAFWLLPENRVVTLDLEDFKDAAEIRQHLAEVAHRFGDATSIDPAG